MTYVTRSLPLAAALLALAGTARATEEPTPHVSIVLAAGLEGRRASGDGVRAAALGGTARFDSSMVMTQDDGAIFHTNMFGEIGGIGGRAAGATGVDFGVGVKVPLRGTAGGFFRLGSRAEYASDRLATLALLAFPRLEIGALYTATRVHVEATARAALTLGSFTPAIVASPSPELPSFATTTHRPLGPGMWGAGIRVLTPYAHLDATWSRFEPSPKTEGHVDQLEARACAGYWVVLCGHAGLVRGAVLVPFRGIRDADLVTFGVSLGVGRVLDATSGAFSRPAQKVAE